MKSNVPPKLIHKHFREGGTGITNLDDADRPLFRAAINVYGDPTLVISDQPMPPMETGISLHQLRPHRDLEDFWRVVEYLRDAGYTPAEKGDAEHICANAFLFRRAGRVGGGEP